MVERNGSISATGTIEQSSKYRVVTQFCISVPSISYNVIRADLDVVDVATIAKKLATTNVRGEIKDDKFSIFLARNPG